MPSQIAKGLRTAKTRSAGIIVPDITNEYFAKITLGTQMELYRKGYTTLICNTNENAEIQKNQLEILRANRVSGIIIISGEDISDEDMTDNIPKVFTDRIPWNAVDKKAVQVKCDNVEGGYIATKLLISVGCKNIAALFNNRRLSNQVERLSGYEKALSEAGIVELVRRESA